MTPNTVTLPEFRDILHWKEQLRSGGEFHFTMDTYPPDTGSSWTSSTAELSDFTDNQQSLSRRTNILEVKTPRPHTFTNFDAVRSPKMKARREVRSIAVLEADLPPGFLKQQPRPKSVVIDGTESSESSAGKPPLPRIPQRQMLYVNERPRPSLKTSGASSTKVSPRGGNQRDHSQPTAQNTEPTQSTSQGPPPSHGLQHEPPSLRQPVLPSEDDRANSRTPKLRFKGISDHADGTLVDWEDSPAISPHPSPRRYDDETTSQDMSSTTRHGSDCTSIGHPSPPLNHLARSLGSDMLSPKSQERYISLDRPQQAEQLPKSLQHINVKDLEHNVPQKSTQPTKGDVIGAQSYESLVDSGIVGNRGSITETSNSTTEMSPQGNEALSYENLSQLPRQNSLRRSHENNTAKSMPNLNQDSRKLSLNQDNIDSIVNSNLSPEEKLNLMASMCDCSEADSVPPHAITPEEYYKNSSYSKSHNFGTDIKSNDSNIPRSKSEDKLPVRTGSKKVERKRSKSSHRTDSRRSNRSKAKPMSKTKHKKDTKSPGATQDSDADDEGAPSIDLSAVDSGKGRHYGIDIEAWMRHQELERGRPETETETDMDLLPHEGMEEDFTKWKEAKFSR